MRIINHKTRYLQLSLVVLLAFIVNANTLSNGFVYDDNHRIVNNSWITSIKYIPTIFTHGANYSEIEGISNYYRPITYLVYMMNHYVFGGADPWGFHLVSIIFHVGITTLVFCIASILFHDIKTTTSGHFLSPSLVAALIFAVHPIHTEVVAWISCTPELSFTLFGLLSLWFNMKSLHNFDRAHYWSLLFFCIAMFCKETAVTVLPLLALYDYLYRSEKFVLRPGVIRYASYLLIVGIYLVLRFQTLGGVAQLRSHPELSAFEVIINILPLFMQYLGKLLVPINLSAFYVLHPVHSVLDPVWLCSFAVVIAFSALSYQLFKKEKAAFLGLMMLLLPLLPVFYIRILDENPFSERYLYFPSIGFALIVGSLINSVRVTTVSLRRTLSVLFLSVLVLYSSASINRNRIWHDEISLWTDTVRKAPDSDIVHNNLGMVLKRQGHLQEATEHFRQALAINPLYVNSHFNLGTIYESNGYIDAALEEFKTVLQINPADQEARMHLEYLLRAAH